LFEQAAAEWEQFRSLPVGEKTEVANAHEPWRQQVKQEPSEKLVGRECHHALAIVVRGVSPAEADVAIVESHQPAIGDGDTMGVGPEITKNMFGAPEWRLGVDDPVLSEQGA